MAHNYNLRETCKGYGITWSRQHNVLPDPRKEISFGQFCTTMWAGTEMVMETDSTQVYLGEKGEGIMYKALFYRMYSQILIVLSCYDPRQQEEIGIGFRDGRYLFRFFRAGCEHKNMKRSKNSFGDTVLDCPDCDYKRGFNSR